MQIQRRTLAIYFFILAFAGLITAWYFNWLAILLREDWLEFAFKTNVDWVLACDLGITAFAVVPFILTEAKRLGMKNRWLYVAASFITAMAFTFPLFLAIRQLKLRSIQLAGGTMKTFHFDDHRVDVWAPAKVTATTPVLVMHDGKNLFFGEHSSYGATWGLLEALRPDWLGRTRIRPEQKPLIIGVWGLRDSTRMLELGPEDIYVAHPEIWQRVPDFLQPENYTPRSNAYQALIAEKILPTIAEKYAIELHVNRTAIAGSSMGAIASMYAMSKYPDVYGTALCYSTHWPFGYELTIEKLINSMPPAGRHRIWTDTGTLELDAEYPPYHELAVKKFESRGYEYQKDFIHTKYDNTGHNENWWSARVEFPINWWLDGINESK